MNATHFKQNAHCILCVQGKFKGFTLWKNCLFQYNNYEVKETTMWLTRLDRGAAILANEIKDKLDLPDFIYTYNANFRADYTITNCLWTF